MIGRMTEHMSYPGNDLCGSCLGEKGEELVHRHLCDYPGLKEGIL